MTTQPDEWQVRRSLRKAELEKRTTIPELVSEWLHDSKHDFSTLPVLDIGEETGWTSYWDWVRSEDMEFPIMKSVDAAKRDGIWLKIENRTNPKQQTVFAYFRRYTEADSTFRLCECHPHAISSWISEYCSVAHRHGGFDCSLCNQMSPDINPNPVETNNLFLFLLLLGQHPVCKLVD